ncbi:MAG: sensor histidine kinase [Acidimicrobiales bacterium]
MSLRTKLLATILGLLALTTLVIDAATYSSLRSFLYQRLDQELTSSFGEAQHVLVAEAINGGQVPQDAIGQWPIGTYLEYLDASGVGLSAAITNSHTSIPKGPKLVTYRNGQFAYNFRLDTPQTLPSQSSPSAHFRILATYQNLPSPLGNGILVIAIPESSIEATLHRLLLVEILVSLGVLLLLSSAGGALLRIGLRPLQDMTDTARAIAAGDLERRVEASGTGGEVNTLAEALNKMLGRIEGALTKSRNSEDRLRVFIADVSHELRTPLTSIQGYAELYRRGALSSQEDLDRAVDRIESESQRMAMLVEDLLMLARMDQNRPLVLEEVDMSALLASAVQDASVVQPNRTITTAIDQTYWVLGDRNKLSQVVANLLSNVRSHTPETAAVVVSAHRIGRLEPIPSGARSTREVADLFGEVDPTIQSLEWDAYLRIEVADSGPGLERDQLAKVFERFYRTDASRSRAAGGAGLGLSLVAAITQAHGGRAWVRSDGPGKGATFGIDLPLIDQLDSEDELGNATPFGTTNTPDSAAPSSRTSTPPVDQPIEPSI